MHNGATDGYHAFRCALGASGIGACGALRPRARTGETLRPPTTKRCPARHHRLHCGLPLACGPLASGSEGATRLCGQFAFIIRWSGRLLRPRRATRPVLRLEPWGRWPRELWAPAARGARSARRGRSEVSLPPAARGCASRDSSPTAARTAGRASYAGRVRIGGGSHRYVVRACQPTQQAWLRLTTHLFAIWLSTRPCNAFIV